MNAPLPLHALGAQAATTALGTPVADADPQETAEWRDAFLALVATQGPERARFVLDELAALARQQHTGWQPTLNTPYVNTVAVEAQPVFPGDLAIEERLASLMRWNALAMVVRANQAYGELGGHIASYASAADLFEAGFNHFFRAREGTGPGQHRGDLVFFQPHSAPGVYARAYLEGRLTEHDLQHYRQEITAPAAGAQGLSSYPHPWLMPDFWQFPTGSMGIGPISSIYHARFMRYLTHRNLLDCQGRKVWGVFGDGEMDEPESMSALTLAAREGLDNLVWVVNCNLQRLDGPVRGNGRIVDELERLFAGAGWNVVKLLWGSDWDGLFARDLTGTLARTLGGTVDGQMQTFAAKDGRYNRDHFFGQSPELVALAQGLTDEQIDRLKRGGHDLVKIHAAYAAAAAHRGQPTVVLAHTKKGYGMGTAGQGRMTTHSQKKLDESDLLEFRNRFNLPLTDAQATGLAFYRPAGDSPEMRYLRERRAALGGTMPRRTGRHDAAPRDRLRRGARATRGAIRPVRAAGPGQGDEHHHGLRAHAGRTAQGLAAGPAHRAHRGRRGAHLRHGESLQAGGHLQQPGPALRAGGHRLGAELPRGAGRPDPGGGHQRGRRHRQLDGRGHQLQRARPGDAAVLHLLLHVRLPARGRRHLGRGRPARAGLPARRDLGPHHAGRRRAAAPGRLQPPRGRHHSQLQGLRPGACGRAGRHPGCRHARDAVGAARRVLLRHAHERELRPARPAAGRGGRRAARLLCVQWSHAPHGQADAPAVTLLGSGAILTEVVHAAQALAAEGVQVTVVSVTSWSELARDGVACEQRLLQGDAEPGTPWLAQVLKGTHGPVVAATDYVRAVPESVRAFLPEGRRYVTLGTDGFGRSDTRAALRSYFGVDAASVAEAARSLLRRDGAAA